SDQNLYQACVHGVFATADAALNYKSRYKSEVSFDMGMETDSIPRPLMHRDPNNPDCTEPSHNWMARIKEVDGYKPGEGYIRRPDLTIVKNPAKPPSVDNIERVIEYKFRNDSRSADQDDDYKDIAGGPENYSIYRIGGKPKKDEQICNCKNPGQIL
ncbi:VRR-NUC domain-containing protein, partial [Sessilibacter sp. MAH4]